MRAKLTKFLTVLGAIILTATSTKAMAFHMRDLFHHHPSHNIWNEMGDHFVLTDDATDHRLVRLEIQRFREQQYDLFQITTNSRPYIYYVYQQTRQRGMPAALALLPMVESDYSPFEHSSVGATGLWQLMPSTATGFGIKIDWWFDGRRDIVSSTNTALNYLQYLHDTFHTWDLAIAAYNSGPGTVWDAIRYNKRRGLPTDFWDLPLPEQTKEYVPKLLALASIIQKRSHYGLRLLPVPNKQYFTSVKMHQQMNIAELASMADMKDKAFRLLNPAFRRSETAPFYSYNVLVPLTKAHDLKNSLAELNAKEEKNAPHGIKHTVRSGESLSLLAHRYHTTMKAIEKLNHMKRHVIRIGEVLYMPKVSKHQTSHYEKKHHSTISETHLPGPHPITYTVKKGDSLYKIRHKFHVSSRQIFYWNHFGRHTMLKPGMKLKLLVKR